MTTRLGTADAWNLSVGIKNEAKQPIGNNIGVWISTDPRRLPVKIQAELPVGNFVLALRDVK